MDVGDTHFRREFMICIASKYLRTINLSIICKILHYGSPSREDVKGAKFVRYTNTMMILVDVTVYRYAKAML